MNLTDARKTALMAYCRIDELDAGEAVLLESLYAAAVAYMEQAGVSEPKVGRPGVPSTIWLSTIWCLMPTTSARQYLPVPSWPITPRSAGS